MSIDSQIRRAVCFIGVKNGEVFQPRATAFFVSWIEDSVRWVYTVTAQHVIARARERNQDLFIRVDMKGTSPGEMEIKSDDFLYHPDNASEATDVAVSLSSGSGILDGMAIPLNGPESMACSDEELEAEYVGLGDQIYIVGLFRYHGGRERNLPIIRVGNLAAFSEEPLQVGDHQEMRGYLIEARSIGGLSGSPVFVSPPVGRLIQGRMQTISAPQPAYLLGLVHGHYDAPSFVEDSQLWGEAGAVGINTGIGIVVPTSKIAETIAQPQAQAERSSQREHYCSLSIMDDIWSPTPSEDTDG